MSAWEFADDSVPGRPVTRIEADGRVGLGGAQTIVFRDVVLRDSDVDLGTVRRLAPAVILEGRLAAVGRLDGPLRDVTFEGLARHQDGNRPVSEIEGIVRLDTQTDTLGIATDVALQPLSFEGIRRAFPGLEADGSLTGRVRLDGTLAQLQVDALVSGEIGTIEAVGTATVLPPRWGADNLRLDFRGLDLAMLSDSAPPTSLTGRLLVSGVADTAQAPEADVALELSRGRIREFRLDTLLLRGSVHDSLIRIDSTYGRIAGMTARGGGTLGWVRPHSGEMRLVLATDSLGVFDSLLHAVTGIARDTAADAVPLGGTVTGALTLARSLDTLRVSAELAGQNLQWQLFRAPVATALRVVGRRRAAPDHRRVGSGHAHHADPAVPGSVHRARRADRLARLARGNGAGRQHWTAARRRGALVGPERGAARGGGQSARPARRP